MEDGSSGLVKKVNPTYNILKSLDFFVEIIIKIDKKMLFSLNTIVFLKSYYINLIQFVAYNEFTSKPYLDSSGVPQECVNELLISLALESLLMI